MKHYDITIIGASQEGLTLAYRLQDHYKVLLVDSHPLNKKYNHTPYYDTCIDTVFSTRYRNTIKSDTGYIVILHKERKNIQISTDILIRAEEKSVLSTHLR